MFVKPNEKEADQNIYSYFDEKYKISNKFWFAGSFDINTGICKCLVVSAYSDNLNPEIISEIERRSNETNIPVKIIILQNGNKFDIENSQRQVLPYGVDIDVCYYDIDEKKFVTYEDTKIRQEIDKSGRPYDIPDSVLGAQRASIHFHKRTEKYLDRTPSHIVNSWKIFLANFLNTELLLMMYTAKMNDVKKADLSKGYAICVLNKENNENWKNGKILEGITHHQVRCHIEQNKKTEVVNYMSFSDKYRPKTFDTIIGQEAIVDSIKSKGKELTHMLFVGPPGCGKTTLARVIGLENDIPVIEKNASDERRIENIRGDIKRDSKISGKRIILLDEADNLTEDSMEALRGIVENSRSAIFIFTGNNESSIIEPIKSRCAVYRFNKITDDIVRKHILEVCDKEKVIIDEEANIDVIQDGINTLIQQSKGDLRTALNKLEQVIDQNKMITEKSLRSLVSENVGVNILEKAINGNFEEAKNKIEEVFINAKSNPQTVIKELYDAIGKIPELKYRVKLYVKLSETARSVKYGNDAIVEFVAFVAYAFMVPHFSNDCPVMKGSGE